MTKKMRELLKEIEQHNQKAAEYLNADTPDTEKAAAELDAADKLQKEYELHERLEAREKAGVPAPTEEEKNDSVNGFGIMAKLLRGRPLTEKELEAIAIDEKAAAELEKSSQQLVSGTNATNGENYLIPEDVNLAIHELRRSYISLRDYITVEETSTLSGSVNFGSDPSAGLVAFDDGDALDDNSAPTITKKTYTIKWYGAFIPVSQILEDAQKANLMGYLKRWFVKRAVISENTKIIAVLKAGYNSGTPKAISGYAGLKSAINKDLDPACWDHNSDAIIITNQDGYDCLDQEVDGEGRPILRPNPANPSEMMIDGVRVVRIATAKLPNISSGHFPIFFGDLKEGAIMKLYKNLLFATSAHANFTKAQNLIRVMEGFDVITGDNGSYIYGSLTASA